MLLELPKDALSLAIMVRDGRALWGYFSLFPTADGLRFVLVYKLPVPLGWNANWQ
jgi:hypothetical protein